MTDVAIEPLCRMQYTFDITGIFIFAAKGNYVGTTNTATQNGEADVPMRTKRTGEEMTATKSGGRTVDEHVAIDSAG